MPRDVAPRRCRRSPATKSEIFPSYFHVCTPANPRPPSATQPPPAPVGQMGSVRPTGTRRRRVAATAFRRVFRRFFFFHYFFLFVFFVLFFRKKYNVKYVTPLSITFRSRMPRELSWRRRKRKANDKKYLPVPVDTRAREISPSISAKTPLAAAHDVWYVTSREFEGLKIKKKTMKRKRRNSRANVRAARESGFSVLSGFGEVENSPYV